MQQYRLGIDIGSTTVKIAILDPEKNLMFSGNRSLEHQVVGIDAVEHVVVEEERDFALHAVGLAQPAYLEYFFLPDHTRSIFAPKALSRASMSS